MSSTSTDDAPLAGYQERRLAELTAAVVAGTERGARASAVRTPRRAGRARRRSVWAAAGVACATAAGVLAWPGGTQPAYAVTRDASGLVTVKVTEEILNSRNADALSRELRSLGVPAVVFSIPEGQVCPQPHARTVTLPPNVYDMPGGLYTLPRDLPRPDGGWQMTIDPGRFRPGQFMVWTLTTSGMFDQDRRRVGSATSTGTFLVTGRVVPCRYRPAPRKQPPPAAPKDGKGDGAVMLMDSGGYVAFANGR
ncbi:hypothetical protein ACFQU9_01275 [Actinomadura namibiensis]|uniref:Uncharacterized protein n=1 Tax=Actinomadura namibiensis TaxID=182080 RepID=A0A7W3QLM8_ACTNM|nr:hypothetical protein [Actinomadura namibiensis]MBA8951163.1 hypothetical protein [Actinomadura namibiensis]